MGNKNGSSSKLNEHANGDVNGNKKSHDKKSAHASSNEKSQTTSHGLHAKTCDTEPTNRRRSSGAVHSASAHPNASAPTQAQAPKKKPFLLTEHQKQMLIRSWKLHANRHSTENIGVRIYFKIFDSSPEIKQIFGFTDSVRDELLFNKRFQHQAKVFVNVVEQAVRDVDRLEAVVQPRLLALGGRHAKFRSIGFKMQYWDSYAECMLECILDAQGLHKYRGLAATWRIFISWMTGVMKQGYYEALRAQRRNTTANIYASTPTIEIRAAKSERNHSLAPVAQQQRPPQITLELPLDPVHPTSQHTHSRSAPQSPYIVPARRAQSAYITVGPPSPRPQPREEVEADPGEYRSQKRGSHGYAPEAHYQPQQRQPSPRYTQQNVQRVFDYDDEEKAESYEYEYGEQQEEETDYSGDGRKYYYSDYY